MSRLVSPVRLIEAAACILAVLAIRQVPAPRAWTRPNSTPFDAGPVASVAPAYALLRAAERVVPSEASVVARREPADPKSDTYFYRAAVALLPQRNVLPAALHFRESTRYEDSAQYLILLGRVDALPGFHKVLETAQGSVWRRGS